MACKTLALFTDFSSFNVSLRIQNQRMLGIGTAAGNDSAGLPKTVNSTIPSGVALGQFVMVNRTKRHFTGGISSKIVFREMVFFVWSRAVVYVCPSNDISILY